ncbi:unnamed protein product [Vitrella brassicaformis CCMP3155]|uniref:Mitochondrial carrier protein n=1 Tax=Vitrella brassicaformis (strain CCMP3155) TaxID=1169540 RepID=A0A0G4GED7_VITBC|nr:unnamed protein product [Vitrella brassicaformis CCMP3155]|eukprot:CEM27727.1 unnamed protein product [Vitrella brassicaformis CCMP3155]
MLENAFPSTPSMLLYDGSSFRSAPCPFSSLLSSVLTAVLLQNPLIDLVISSSANTRHKRERPSYHLFTQHKVDWLHHVAGVCGGLAACVCGHPLDTMKARIALSHSATGSTRLYSGLADCIRQTWLKEGLRGFYRGLPFPLVGDCLVASASYGVYGNTLAFLERANANGELPGGAWSRPMLTGAAGAAGGAIASVVECPFDMLKTQMQVEACRKAANEQARRVAAPRDAVASAVVSRRAAYELEALSYRGLGDCLTEVVRAQKVYAGLSAVFLRNTPGFAIAYSTFDALKRLQTPPGQSESVLTAPQLMLAGGLSGVLFWAAAYPFDVVRANLQGQSAKLSASKARFNGVVDCAVKLYLEGGVVRFYRGLLPAVSRALPANAVCYYVYTLVVQTWSGK